MWRTVKQIDILLICNERNKKKNENNDEFSPLAIIQVENEELHKIIERG